MQSDFSRGGKQTNKDSNGGRLHKTNVQARSTKGN
jgi:hypothetical protein